MLPRLSLPTVAIRDPARARLDRDTARGHHEEVRGTAMNKSRYFAAAGLAASAAIILSGCAGGAAGDADAAPAESGEVTWWGWTPDTTVAERYIAAFNAEYPDIEVTYRNFENVDFRNTIVPAL